MTVTAGDLISSTQSLLENDTDRLVILIEDGDCRELVFVHRGHNLRTPGARPYGDRVLAHQLSDFDRHFGHPSILREW
ncbi:hypothetical protein GT755_30520 [Herbidospora sp. NEAU-GS84]|uniref:Uncharacterized protein n=1 Tax=Herbidospora solisilvae TaxID=2696284 RepID=A0A7C9J7J6_9ACTN|nr:hypothetical protein [Herbidospora solisilvae]